jgi:hypothetical protein
MSSSWSGDLSSFFCVLPPFSWPAPLHALPQRVAEASVVSLDVCVDEYLSRAHPRLKIICVTAEARG